jgi:hypothetical protein
MLRSIRDVVDATQGAGRVHLQRFYKVAGLAGDSLWQDWAYATGQPGVDARVGNALEFTPFVATKNKAIWFPDIAAGQERRILEVNVCSTAGGASQASCCFMLYDLVGVYPLIDGDSVDAQIMDNTQPYPRYADSESVIPVLVNHVSAQLQVGTGVYSYVSRAGNTFTDVPFGVVNAGLGKSAAASSQAGTATLGTFGMPLGGNSGGVARITSLQFLTPPSGLWAIYMVRPLMKINNNDGMLVAGSKCASEKRLIQHNACSMPLIYDGAHLGFFYMPVGGGRTVAIAGHITFVWG